MINVSCVHGVVDVLGGFELRALLFEVLLIVGRNFELHKKKYNVRTHPTFTHFNLITGVNI